MRWWAWIDVAPVLDRATAIGRIVDGQKDSLPGTRNWANGSTHGLGFLGEYVFGARVGVRPNLDVLVGGDGGRDFPEVDVKLATYLPDPDLKVHPDDWGKPVRYFALVAYDAAARRAAYLGWQTREFMFAAPLRNYGHGPMHACNWRNVRAGVPPVRDLEMF